MHDKRDEGEYLALYNCLQHLSMVEESVVALGKGFADNRTSLTIRNILEGVSSKWKDYFQQEKVIIIRLQSWMRMLLAWRIKQRLVEEKMWQRRQERIWNMNIKWEMRRALGSYTDRKKKVMKRDFFKLWRESLHGLRSDKEQAAIMVQSVGRVILAKARIRKEIEKQRR